jgi:hypothetical protein
MALGRFGGAAKGEDVATLIGKKNYSKAIEVIRDQLKTQRNDPRLRLQLADVLVSAGKAKEAVTILLPLADEFAKEGFAAKAISVLKKIQKVDPGRRDIDSRLAGLIEEKQKQAVVAAPPSATGGFEFGMEEIGFEPPLDRTPSVPEPPPPARPAAAPAPPPRPPAPPPPPPRPPVAAAPEPELELETAPELDLSGAAEPVVESGPPVVEETAGAEFDLGVEGPAEVEAAPLDLALEPEEALPLLEVEPIVAASAPHPPPAAAATVVDQDLLTGEFESAESLAEGDLVLEPEPTVEVEAEPDPAATDPMTDSRFADELFSVLENAFQAPATAADAVPDTTPTAGAEIVVSPLFKDFSVDELVAVIGGLNLLTFERGNVILREGEPGHSLYMLTSGSVKAFVRRDGKQVPIAELEEGAFFGEVSILTGKPRTATIVAKEHCELLELDRATLDAITQTHPHVRDVLQEFANQRMARKG